MDKSNIEIFRVLFFRKKHILLISIISVVLAYVFTMPLFIRPIYKSTAFVYPANLGLYSEESQTEQMLQFLQSNDIRQYLYKKYNLAKHYKIDTLKKTHMFTYDEIYDKKVSISITKYESVEIKVEDYSPDTAKLLVHGIIDAVNWLIEKEHREKYVDDVNNAKILVDYTQHEVDSTQRILNELSEKYGVVDMPIQLKEAARSYYKDMNGNAKLTELIANLGKHGVEFVKLSAYIGDQVKNYALAVNEYEKRLSDLHSRKSFVALASKPTYPVVASWPKRTIVMVITGLSIFILACIYFIFIDKAKFVYQQITSESAKK
ncbi:MAG TPA: Wzz/FepE/Etk N-terminal domain-containing protein [Bacteroidia bacterium]|nr:Wzz/FepE/Etk N-terminal domain-containing protein [Bacteroidia bacterium]